MEQKELSDKIFKYLRERGRCDDLQISMGIDYVLLGSDSPRDAEFFEALAYLENERLIESHPLSKELGREIPEETTRFLYYSKIYGLPTTLVPKDSKLASCLSKVGIRI